MNRYLAILVLIMGMIAFSGCSSNPSKSSNGIVLRNFQKPGDAVTQLEMTSGDRLYIGWAAMNSIELTATTSTQPSRVYVSAYDGKALSPLGGVVGTVNSVFTLGFYNNSPVIAMVDTTETIIVKQWSGNTWTDIGTLPLANVSDTVVALSRITATANNLYIAYGERFATGAAVINVYRFDGSNWHALPSPAVIPSGSYLFSLDMAILNDNPVVIWMAGSDSTGKETIPVMQWNGTQWVTLSDNMKIYSTPWLMSMGSSSCSITGMPGGIAVMWNEGMPFTDSTGMMSDLPIGIVSTYNGTQWTQLGTVNRDEPGIATDDRDAEQLKGLWINSRLYIAFVEMAQVYLAYNGTNGFGYVGDSLNAHPYALLGNPVYIADSPSIVRYNGETYLSFIEEMRDQNTMTISYNPYIRGISQ